MQKYDLDEIEDLCDNYYSRNEFVIEGKNKYCVSLKKKIALLEDKSNECSQIARIPNDFNKSICLFNYFR